MARFVVVILILLGGIFGAGQAVLWWTSPGPLPADKTVVLFSGGTEATAQHLADAGIIDNPMLFAIAAKVMGASSHFKLGEYEYPAHISPSAVVDLLISGKTVRHKLTIPEGFTSGEVMVALANAPAMSGSPPAKIPEGSVLPSTYFYSYGDSRVGMAQRMEQAMTSVLIDIWPARDPDLPITSTAEAVTMASIVEKETSVPAERSRIAAVFYNRLKLNMKLQSDPTTIYGITQGLKPLGRPLTHGDLADSSPYNTYVITGLPPGPIANPSKASLLAVLHPDHTRELYFVADGSGGHAFAETLDSHNRNVTHLRQAGKPGEVKAPAKP